MIIAVCKGCLLVNEVTLLGDAACPGDRHSIGLASVKNSIPEEVRQMAVLL